MEDSGGHPAQSRQGAKTTQIEELDF